MTIPSSSMARRRPARRSVREVTSMAVVNGSGGEGVELICPWPIFRKVDKIRKMRAVWSVRFIDRIGRWGYMETLDKGSR